MVLITQKILKKEKKENMGFSWKSGIKRSIRKLKQRELILKQNGHTTEADECKKIREKLEKNG